MRCEELKLDVEEQEVVLREMEAAMQLLAMDADRRLTQQHRDHQNDIQLLLQKLQGEEIKSVWIKAFKHDFFVISLSTIFVQKLRYEYYSFVYFSLLACVCVCLEGGTGEAQQAIQDRLQRLEKELFFYKSSSRQLKKKLKELLSGALHPDDQPQNDRQSHNMLLHASANNSQTHTEEIQTRTHIRPTYTKILAEQTDQKSASNLKKLGHQTPSPCSSSELQVSKKTKMPEYKQIHIQSQGSSERKVGGQGLEMTPVRLCRRELRQISPAELQVSGSATRRRQSVVSTSTESVLEDSIEVPRNTDR